MRSLSLPTALGILIIVVAGLSSMIAAEGDQEPFEDIMPLDTQVPLSFRGWDRDSDENRVDDMLSGNENLDVIEGMIGINVHMKGPVTAKDVRSVMERAEVLGMDPVFLRVGSHTTAIYLLVRESKDFQSLLIGNVEFVEYRPMTIPFLDSSSPGVRAASSSVYSPFTAEDLGYTGEGITIAVLDSGVDNNLHESLRGKYEYGVDFTGTTVVQGLDPDDVDGHGTHVAGTALGSGGGTETYRGTAPEASLVDLKIFKTFGSFLGNSDQAFEWLIDNHEERDIKVVSCSFGSTNPTSGRDTTAQLANRLVDEGVVVVAAVGNDGAQGIPSPASADKVISVGAYTDQDTIGRGDDVVQGFSNRGPRNSDGDLDQTDELKPDISAPGRDIRAPNHNSVFEYVDKTGTSMSCPHISGIAALMLQANPELSPSDVKSILRDTAQQEYSPSRQNIDDKYNYRSGWGLVDAYGAVKRSVDLLNLEISSPVEVASGIPLDIRLRGEFTKTEYDETPDIHEMELRTPYSWGIPDDIRTDPDMLDADVEVIGPGRSGDSWITTMRTYYNSSFEGAEPELSVTVIPSGGVGDSGNVLGTLTINGINLKTEVKEINITEGPSPPDLSIVPLAISFSDNLPENGDTVEINVRVNNTGGRTVENALIRLLDGPERTGTVIGEDTIMVPSSSFGMAEFEWVANPGIHAITAIADPENEIAESDEDNNEAERPLTVRGINPPPVAQLEVSPAQGTTVTRFVFDGSSSQDTNIRGGNVVAYNFDFGDGTESGWVDTSIIEHRYLSGGSYTASLRVRDNGGGESTNDAEVQVNVSEVSSSKQVLYLTNDSRLDPDPGPPGSREVEGRVGEWSSDPLEETRMIGSLLSLRMEIKSMDQGEMEYEIGLLVDGDERVFHTGSQTLLGGEQSFQVDITIQELIVKAGEDISIVISATSSASDTRLLVGEDGTFLEYMYYNPPNMPPEVNAGEDIEVRVDAPVTFSGTADDPDGNIEDIRWDVDDDGVYESEGVLTFEYSGYNEEGIFQAVLEVMDDDGAWSSDSLEVTVRPSDYNFPPSVTIDCGKNLTGMVEITGTAEDDVSVESVEVRIESSDGEVLPWTEADGEEEWSLEWDSRGVPDGEYTISARAFDGSVYSETDTCPVRVSNINTPPEIIDFEMDPPSMISGQEIMIMITAVISDPDIPGDSLEVIVDLGNLEGPPSLALADDGRGADEEDGDGIFSAVFDPPVDIRPGTYRIFVEARDSAGGIDQDFVDFSVVSDIMIIPDISPTDLDPGEEVLIEVEIDTTLDVIIRAESELFPNGSVTLNDQGLEGDRVLGDGIYSRKLAIDGDPGRYPVLIIVEEDGSVLSREEMVIRIVGSPQTQADEESGLVWVLIAGAVVILLTLVIVLMIVLGRRSKPKIDPTPVYDLPMVAEVVEAEVLEGELPVEGEMPEVSQDPEYSYQDGSLQAE